MNRLTATQSKYPPTPSPLDREPYAMISTPVPLSAAAVARRAYATYVARGSQPGHDVADWLDAEAQLVAEDHVAQMPSAAYQI